MDPLHISLTLLRMNFSQTPQPLNLRGFGAATADELGLFFAIDACVDLPMESWMLLGVVTCEDKTKGLGHMTIDALRISGWMDETPNLEVQDAQVKIPNSKFNIDNSEFEIGVCQNV